MNLAELPDLFEKMLQRGQLPPFLAGAFFGVIFGLAVARLVRSRQSSGLVNELRNQVMALKGAYQVLEQEKDGVAAGAEATRRELALTVVNTHSQAGSITTLNEKVAQTSATCERLTLENFELRDRLKVERKSLREVRQVAEGYSSQLDDVANSDGKIWLRSMNGHAVPFLPLNIRRTPIISLANFKGGVGKTTLTANLGAAFAAEGLRVLLIDLDHQSSLSGLCLEPGEVVEVKRAGRYVNGLFAEGGDLSVLNRYVTRLGTPVGDGSIYLAPVDENFVDTENRLMTRWHSGLTAADVRLRLRVALHSPQLRDQYDVVLIDCPPRLTTGCINALAASDYVLIPVLLESTSAEAVPRILRWLKLLQQAFCTELDVLGVVGNKAYRRNKLINREAVIWEDLRDRCRASWGEPVRQFEEIIREHPVVAGRFAALDPKHKPRYSNLVAQIRQEVPSASLQPSAVHTTHDTTVDGRGA